MKFLKLLGLRAWTALKIILKTALLLPIPAFMVWFNFTVDRSGLFFDETENYHVAQALAAGQNLYEYDKLDERELYTQLAQVIDEPYDTIALGSSRVLMLQESVVGGGSYMSCGVSAADFRDVLGMFYRFDKAGMLPKNLILVADPWLLSTMEEAQNPLADGELYNEFLATRLGVAAPYRQAVETDRMAKYRALFSPSYFQGNLEYWFDRPEDVPPDQTHFTGPANLDEATGAVKLADGSVLYPLSFRTMDSEAKAAREWEDINALGRMQGYTQPDEELCGIFERFIAYAKQQGVNVSILLEPYPPLVYNFAQERADALAGFFAAEEFYRQCAARWGVPVYGSYNPFVVDFTTEDFYDGLHPKPESLGRIFPGVAAAAEAQGQPGSLAPHGNLHVSYATAQRLVAERYGIAAPEVAVQGDDQTIYGEVCYTVQRYETDAQDAVMLAEYAVTRRDGVVYRFDTDEDRWMLDERFPQEQEENTQ